MSSSEEDDKKLLEAFHSLGIKPTEPIESADELMEFMAKASAGVKTSGSGIQFAKISSFFGEAGRGEVSYPTWRYEVQSLLDEGVFSSEQITQGIRRSCRGSAADILRRLGTSAKVSDILKKFDSVYSDIDDNETVMRNLYSCKQKPKESVIAYATRVEELFVKAVELEAIDPLNDEILKRIFYAGLNKTLKQMAIYKFETVDDYDKFKVEVRKLENEMNSTETETQAHSMNPEKKSEKQKSEFDELKSMIAKMNEKIDKLEKEKNEPPTPSGARYTNFSRGRGSFNYRGAQRGYRGGRGNSTSRGRGNRPLASNTFMPRCYKCQELGHIAKTCPN